MKKIYYFSMYLIFLIAYLHQFLFLPENSYVFLTSIGIFLLLLSTITMIRGFQLYISLISLAIGHLVLLSYSMGFDTWYYSITKSIGIPILFVAIPMISFPIKYGHYLESVEAYVASKRKKPFILFSLLATMVLALSLTLNIGSIPTMQNLLGKSKLPKKYLARLYTAGYSSYMVFSPYDAVVIMMLLFASVSYYQFFLAGLSMVCLIIGVSALLVRTDSALLEEVNSRLASQVEEVKGRKVYELLTHIVVLIALAFLSNILFPGINQMLIIALIIICYSIFWCRLVGAMDNLKEELKTYSSNLLGYKSFLPFLISATFLASIISNTPLKEIISLGLGYLNALPLYFVIQLLMVFTVALSLVGVHMMITVTTLAFTISPQIIGLGNVPFAMTLLTCWYLAMCISPFAPFAVVVGDTIGEKPFKVTLEYNRHFCLAMIILAPALIYLINRVYI